MHPMARPGTNDKLNGISPGERIRLGDGRTGVLDQSIERGAQGYVTLDDGTHVTVFAEQVSREPA